MLMNKCLVSDYGGHGVIRRVGFQFVCSGGQRLDVPWVAARSTIGERHKWVAAHVATGEKHITVVGRP